MLSTPPTTRVKICGLTRHTDLELAIDVGADAVGFICDVPVETPREIPSDRVATLVDSCPPFVTSVLVTMPSSPADAIELVEAITPDVLQVHSGLDSSELGTVREAIDCQLLVGVDADDVGSARTVDDVADGFVVDSVDADGAGGTGTTHDWERTRGVAAELESPIVLAGGLTPANVTQAIRTVEPFAVDVSSGVESRGGIKDETAVRTFVDRAKNALAVESADSSSNVSNS